MRFVTVKSIEQQDIQAMHRIRSNLAQQRTAKGNQIRGLVSEYANQWGHKSMQINESMGSDRIDLLNSIPFEPIGPNIRVITLTAAMPTMP